MNKFVKILSLILAVLMILPTIVACGGSGDNDDGKGKQDGTVAATKGEGEDTAPKVLEEKNWGGMEYRVLGRSYSTNIFTNFEVDRDELPEDVVGVAVWQRNDTLMQKYGIDVVGTLTDNPANTAKTSLEAGDDNYELIICSSEKIHPFAMQGYLLDIKQLPHINLDHKAWNDYANTQMTMGGKMYYTTNRFLLQDKHRTWAFYYNRELARELNIGYLEDEVFDGSWTMDRLIEISKQASAETDGQDGRTFYDQWGVSLSDKYCFAVMAYGAGFRISENGSDGYPRLIGATDHMISVLDKVYELILDTDSCYTSDVRPTADKKGAGIFTEGRAVIMGHCISKMDEMTESATFEFGLLPNPKIDEKQEDYYSLPNLNNGSMFGIPSTVVNVEYAAHALEAISEESVDTTYYAYIETKCKLQDAFDEDAAKCMEMIFDGVVYDIAFTSDIAGLGSMVVSLVTQKNNTYQRLADRLNKIAEKELNKIRETYSAQ